ncbi:L-seryl-tRNA(Sec) selenium transferase [Campylobacter hepaticus]|uniref:L-seryl-tRNA(Sec) selenium transferase n=1 Tax=Campylobacter hepaticus TaxID=1813019 RepID=A0A6A7JSW7_9BACT|nr:L-seryl-tRNA(Sec) selenium transferase [Campylobacter hepaticus]AXP08996.1 L-seryl-tRNA(Sec) selenium transferase [Campylobacter hepaticus]MCZ0771963.1 L-seryl-tRNA(Sec) selenium transferase [Campylobacter hepaticus]MCZ0773432.1 L-seryl-tRNA(Sec) selenium transferase [Campylobacter hepaticus]MCZ0774682.1 L-seryl-tRNA(Sec) selenium transferase [Campylobacter hepaticus]MDX2323701.1 L-seryl-tRNA(Sec) selenium transferase [Campylobacter hepaticus]
MNKLRNFPQINTLIHDETLKSYPFYIKAFFCKKVVHEYKNNLTQHENSKENLLIQIKKEIHAFYRKDLQSVINASGVVIHTNLGRSVIDKRIYQACEETLCNYSNVEFDLQTGKRGSRYALVLEKLKMLFECEDALIVNNNAAAVFLVLHSLCFNKEVISSRGELVEIGGSFRIPEVIKAAGVKLCEVGTSNKTHLKDYEQAINENTALILKTHKSNFALMGFHSEVNIKDLYLLAQEKNILTYYDLGSGWCENLNKTLTKNEPKIKKIVQECDILSFSADKIFGSVQAGIILGKKELIEKLKQNHLLRMLRVDKFTLSFLNESLKAYLEKNYEKITTLKLLNDDLSNIKNKALKTQERLKYKTVLKNSKSLVGGGCMPDKSLDTYALSFQGDALRLQAQFRNKNIIGRIENNEFLLDFRSIKEDDIKKLIDTINQMDLS